MAGLGQIPGLQNSEAPKRVRAVARTRGLRGPRTSEAALNRDRMEYWSETFRRYDTSGNGTLCFEELRHMVRGNLRLAPRMVNDEDLRLVFKALDTNDDGEVDWNEWLNFAILSDEKPVLRPVQLVLNEVARAVRLALLRQGVRPLEVKKMWSKKAEVDGFGPEGNLRYEEVQRFFRRVINMSVRDCSDRDVRIAFHGLQRPGATTVAASDLVQFVGACDRPCTLKAQWSEAPQTAPSNVARGPCLIAGSRGMQKLPGSSLSGTVPFCLNGRDLAPSSRASLLVPSCLVPPRQRPFRQSTPELPAIIADTAGVAGSPAGSPSRPPTSAGLARCSSQPAPDRRPVSSYSVLRDADILNRVEWRLFEAGIDMRGGYHRRT